MFQFTPILLFTKKSNMCIPIVNQHTNRFRIDTILTIVDRYDLNHIATFLGF